MKKKFGLNKTDAKRIKNWLISEDRHLCPFGNSPKDNQPLSKQGGAGQICNFLFSGLVDLDDNYDPKFLGNICTYDPETCPCETHPLSMVIIMTKRFLKEEGYEI